MARNDVNVRLDSEVVSEAKMVAASRNCTLAEYLSEILRPIVHRDLEAETAAQDNGAKLNEAKAPKGD